MRLLFKGAGNHTPEQPPSTKPKPSREAYVELLTNLTNAPTGREKAECLLSLYQRMQHDHINFIPTVLSTAQEIAEHGVIMDSRTATDLGYDEKNNTYYCPNTSRNGITKAIGKDDANSAWMDELRNISTWAASYAHSKAMEHSPS